MKVTYCKVQDNQTSSFFHYEVDDEKTVIDLAQKFADEMNCKIHIWINKKPILVLSPRLQEVEG